MPPGPETLRYTEGAVYYQVKPRKRSLRPHVWILWVKVKFSYYNQQDRHLCINRYPFELETWYLHPRCIMTRTFISWHKFDLEFVFKVTRIIQNLDIWNFWRWHKLSFFGLEDFYHECKYICWRPSHHTSTSLTSLLEDFIISKIHPLKNYLEYINQIRWPLSRSHQQYTFSKEINGMWLKIHIIILSWQLFLTKLDIQTPFVMFYFLFKYQVRVTLFLALMHQSSIFLQ